MSRALSPTTDHPRQAANEKHGNLHQQSPFVLLAEQSGPATLPLSPLSAARMQRPFARGPPDALELLHQDQLTQRCASGTCRWRFPDTATTLLHLQSPDCVTLSRRHCSEFGVFTKPAGFLTKHTTRNGTHTDHRQGGKRTVIRK